MCGTKKFIFKGVSLEGIEYSLETIETNYQSIREDRSLYGDDSDSIDMDHKKLENGQLMDQDPTESVMSAIYVLGMPFKLLDAGATLEFTQTVTLESGKQADEIKATYNPEAHQNHSTTDVWYYYFDHQDGTFYGAMVHHPPTYAYIQNLDFHEHAGLKFHAHRKSYRSDSLRNIKYLRAEFWYSDYQVE